MDRLDFVAVVIVGIGIILMSVGADGTDMSVMVAGILTVFAGCLGLANEAGKRPR